MKKIMCSIIAILYLNLSLQAQATSQVADRFYSFSKVFNTQTNEQAIRSLITTLETG